MTDGPTCTALDLNAITSGAHVLREALYVKATIGKLSAQASPEEGEA